MNKLLTMIKKDNCTKLLITHTIKTLIEYFKEILEEINWEQVCLLSNSNQAYEFFMSTFQAIHNNAFPLNGQSKSLSKYWMKKVFKNPQKNQNIFDKVLKKKTSANKEKYKEYKSLFEVLRKKSKKLHYGKYLGDCHHNINKIWDTIKQ